MTHLAQAETPLLTALQQAAGRSYFPFHTPGHQQGSGTPKALKDWLGEATFRADLPELPQLDNLFAPQGVIQQAQELAAAAFEAEQTHFLANGSTCGIEAAVLATCRPGDKLILPRNVHQSGLSALILSGAIPVWIQPDHDSAWGMAYPLSAEAVQTALVNHADAKAVLLVSPTYYGVSADLKSIAQMCHERHMPLLVDEAHGAHFAFHADLPASALSAGADLVVQSTHKTLSAFTQAAMLHLQGDRIDRARLRQSLQLVQSTSPNYLLLASLDAARQQMALHGQTLLSQTLELADVARSQLSHSGLTVLTDLSSDVESAGFCLDRTRLTIGVERLGMTGFAADEILHEQLGITAELPALQSLTFLITIGHTATHLQHLVSALHTLTQSPQPQIERSLPALPPVPSAVSLSPREVFFAPAVSVPIERSIGKISADWICPYPPGIPILLPGEQITAEAVAYLQEILAAGGSITGCSDFTLQTLRIVQPTGKVDRIEA